MPSQDRLYFQLGPSTVGNAIVTIRRSDEPAYIFTQLPFSLSYEPENVESF
jgi:hypothetical protein